MAQETGDDEEIAFQIKTHPALKEFPPHYRNGFKLLVSRIKFHLFMMFLKRLNFKLYNMLAMIV